MGLRLGQILKMQLMLLTAEF